MVNWSRPLSIGFIFLMLAGTLAIVPPPGEASHVDNSSVVASLQPRTVLGISAGGTFSISFNVSNVNDLDGWEFTLFFDPLVLTPLASTAYLYEGFTSPASDPLNTKRAITLDDTFGTVAMGATAIPLAPAGITGSGNLARIDFSVDCNNCRTTIEFFDLLLRSVDPAGTIDNITPVSVGVSDFSNQATIPPISEFTYTHSRSPDPNPFVNEPVLFDASPSRDPDGFIVTYDWDFGDGNNASTSSPTITHTYTRVGPVRVVLTVTDDDGLTSEPFAREFIVESPVNVHDLAVVFVQASPSNVTAGQSVLVTGLIANQGDFSENSTVTASYDNATFAILPVFLNPGEVITVEAVLETVGLAPGFYLISVRVAQVPGETDLVDNIGQTSIFVREPGPGPGPADILLLDLGTPEAEGALRLLGVSFVKVSPSEFLTVDLDLFDVLFVGWDSLANPAAFSALNSRRADIADWVARGHGILALSEGSTGLFTWLPLPVTIVAESAEPVVITDSSHPIMSGLTDAALSNWGNSYHNYFTTWDPAYQVLATTPLHNLPITLAASLGLGRIAITGQDPDWHLFFVGTTGAGILLKNMLDWAAKAAGPPPEHDLSVSVKAPKFIGPGTSTILEAGVLNLGISNETNVELQLQIDGIVVNSTIIPELSSGATFSLTYHWTATVLGTHAITAFAPPVLGENNTRNNEATAFVEVAEPLIRPQTGQFTEYLDTVRYPDGRVQMSVVRIEYGEFVSTELINVTITVHDGFNFTSSLLLNIFTREITGDGAWIGWIETNIDIGSIVRIGFETADVVTHEPFETTFAFVDAWRLRLRGAPFDLWYDRGVGVLVGFNATIFPGASESVVLTATNIPLTIIQVHRISLEPTEGVVGTLVTVLGTDAATDHTFEVRYDSLVLGSVAPDAEGNFVFTFTVPPSAMGSHTVTVVDLVTGFRARAVFIVIPSVTVSPTSGPAGTRISIVGTGLPAFAFVLVQFDGLPLTGAVADESGSLTASAIIPFAEPGDYTIQVAAFVFPGPSPPDGSVFVTTVFTVVDETALAVVVDTGVLYFPGDTGEVFIQVSVHGRPVDATDLTIVLRGPDGSTSNLPATRVGQGLYRTSISIPSGLGVYLVEAQVSYVTHTADSHGATIRSFEVKSAWMSPRVRTIATMGGSISFAALFAGLMVYLAKRRKTEDTPANPSVIPDYAESGR